jgi:O-antigen/teichoic acid export membrane protein
VPILKGEGSPLAVPSRLRLASAGAVEVTENGSLALNTLSAALARGMTGAVLLLGSIIVARESGVDAVGSFGIAAVLGMFAAVLADAGLSLYLVPKLATSPRTEWSPLWASVRRFHLVTVAPLAAAYAAFALIVYDGSTATAVLAAIPWWAMVRISLAIRSFMVVAERLEFELLASLLEALAGLAALWLIVASGGSVAGAMLGLGAGAALGVLVRWIALRRLGICGGDRSQTPKELFLASSAFNGFNVLSVAYARADVVMMSLLSTPFALGLYQAPVRLVTAMLLLPEGLSLVMQGRVSRAPHDVDLHAFQQRLLGFGVAISLIAVVVVVLLGNRILVALYGAEFKAAVTAFVLLALVVPIRLASYLNGNQLVAHGLQTVRLRRMAATAVFAVVAGVPAIIAFDYEGAAAVTLATEVLLGLLYAHAVQSHIGRRFVLLPVHVGRRSFLSRGRTVHRPPGGDEG